MVSTIRSLPFLLFALMVFFPAVITAVLMAAGLKARKRAAIMKATPTSNIGMAEDGYRELEGRIEPIDGEPIAAELTGWPCVWYRAKVEKFTSGGSGKQSASWTTVRQEISGMPFFVRDSTGACLVEPWGADVTPTDRSVWHGATETPADRNPAKVAAGESAAPSVEVAGGPNSKFRYTEERIYAGDPLLVLGEFTTGRRAVAWDAADDDADDDEGDGDGDSSDSELTEEDREEIAADERAEAIREKARQTTKSWVGRGAATQPFILSTTLQAVDVAQSSMGAQASLTGAAIPAAIALFLLWARFA